MCVFELSESKLQIGFLFIPKYFDMYFLETRILYYITTVQWSESGIHIDANKNQNKVPFISCLTELLMWEGSLIICVHFLEGTKWSVGKEMKGSYNDIEGIQSFSASLGYFCFLGPSLMYSFGIATSQITKIIENKTQNIVEHWEKSFQKVMFCIMVELLW